jgi:hypothetical protein
VTATVSPMTNLLGPATHNCRASDTEWPYRAESAL